MNRTEIEKLAGYDVARTLCPEEGDIQDGNSIDPEDLDDLLRGSVILGVEPVDYPCTDGLIFYLRLKNGTIYQLDIDQYGEPAEGELYRPDYLDNLQVSGSEVIIYEQL